MHIFRLYASELKATLHVLGKAIMHCLDISEKIYTFKFKERIFTCKNMIIIKKSRKQGWSYDDKVICSHKEVERRLADAA